MTRSVCREREREGMCLDQSVEKERIGMGLDPSVEREREREEACV